MPFVIWDKKYEIGQEIIDEQHKNRIEILNEFFDALKSGTELSLAKKELEKLKDYTDYHFEYEEKMMEDVGFPDLEEHIKLHVEFKNHLKGFEQKRIDSVQCDELFHFLKDWFLDHIIVEDKKYLEFLS